MTKGVSKMMLHNKNTNEARGQKQQVIKVCFACWKSLIAEQGQNTLNTVRSAVSSITDSPKMAGRYQQKASSNELCKGQEKKPNACLCKPLYHLNFCL
jgi:hypothetical protein